MEENAKTPQENSIKGKSQVEHIGRSGAKITCEKVKDTILIRKESSLNPLKLKAQYEWILANQNHTFIPKVLDYIETPNSFSYDMEFYEKYENCYEVLARENVIVGMKTFQGIVQNMSKLCHPLGRKTKLENYQSYIQEKLVHKINECINKRPEIIAFLEEKNIIINGEEYLSFPKIIQELEEEKVSSLFIDLEMCNVHGDLTLENILIDKRKHLIFLDPNNDNTLATIHLDIGKLFQSLHSEYEYFFNKDLHTEEENNEIREKLSYYLSFLEGYVKDTFSKEDLLRVKFHEAMHLSRLLPYIINKEEPIWTHFIHLTIIRFNEFLQEVKAF
ncbi:hypothetical protein A9Q84_09030 [Halobacteriovorax marinus]|uniref:Aminoglycoside phosphotransferase domain-containing protein n=1 Tax=Halobacteriovorax marinus TaxID=97084 RepID=A0A1Y5FCX9_9BACT|nr:hypothetical protein A9Q84_09030 [Halobacteriovorax marinus]